LPAHADAEADADTDARFPTPREVLADLDLPSELWRIERPPISRATPTGR
jgi:hypothetical protein